MYNEELHKEVMQRLMDIFQEEYLTVDDFVQKYYELYNELSEDY